MNDTPKPKRRWRQFSLRTLLVLVFLASIPLSWFAVKMQQAREQRQIVEAIQKLGGSVEYGVRFSDLIVPRSLRNVLGDDFFGSVSRVVFDDCQQVTDSELDHLNGLSQLESLSLNGTCVTDAGLEHLKRFPQLYWLSLDGTQVTDAGLKHLEGLGQLLLLSLNGSRVTDAGLEHLSGLTRLVRLSLADTKVTDEGVEELSKALPKTIIRR